MAGRWHRRSSRYLFESPWFRLRQDELTLPGGEEITYTSIEHGGYVVVLPLLDDGRVVMEHVYRHTLERAVLECPCGGLDGQSAADAARRELEEETGHRAGSWRLLTSFWTAPGFATELMHLYLATDLVPAHEDRLGPDDDERLELERLPWPEALAAAERGEIADAKSLVALLWLDRLTLRDRSPAG